MEFSNKECWSKLLFPPSGAFLDSGIEPASPASPALAGGFFTTFFAPLMLNKICLKKTSKANLWSLNNYIIHFVCVVFHLKYMQKIFMLYIFHS